MKRKIIALLAFLILVLDCFAPLSYAADTSELITITKTVKDNSADIVDKKVADDTNAEYYLMNYNNYVVVKFTIEKPGVYAITPFVTYAQTASTLTVTTSVEDKTFTNSYTTSTVNGTELNVEAGEHTFYAGEYTITFKKGAGASIHFRGITLTCRRELLPSEIPVEKLTLTKTVKDNRSDIVGTPDIAEDKTDSFLMYMNDDVTFKFKVSVPGVYKIVPFGTYGSTGILKFTTTVQSTVFTTELPQVSTGSTLSAEAGEYIFHSGEYDIKFEKIAGANLLFEGIRLVYDRELTTFEADVPMIKTVADITDSSEAITGKYASFWAFGEGNYITFTYDIPTAGVYSMQFIGGCGTDKVSGSATFKVEIDGNTYYKNFKTQANFYEQVEVFVADHAFAEAGTYNLTITPISIPVGSMTIRSVTLDMINYLEPDDVEYSVTHNAAENYKVSDVAVDATTTACMLGAGNCIAWNVTPAYNGHYEIFVNAASVNASLGAYKNELQIGECRFTDSAADASSAKYVSLGEVALFAGESYVIKIESFRKSAAEVYLSDIKLVFRSGFADELIVKDIVILNEDGVRMPHAVIDGATASAQITVYKSGRVNDEIKLFFAQYAQDGALASVASVACDVSEMSDKETGTFAKELVFSGNGGSVRVFMLENGTLKPLYCPIGYEETDIFANVEFPAEVPYKLASEVLDEHNITYDANAYTTTETEDYKIDAIFYDSVVGEQTKVFAYLGIPKTASKENPVPAMVLVHGAGGEADIRWVKKWNERGYAAISMDLYGTGPETDDAAVNGQKAHGFGGVLPWGNDGEAFRADFERAGMYQNVINVYNAHTLLLGLDCIAKDKTGISGISYGAVTTTVVSGVDERFKLAAPIYGGGYVDKTKTYFANASFKSFVGTSLAWEPSNFAAKATMPVLYVNNNCDAAFSADTTSWTKGVTPNAYLSLRHGLKHDMGHGMSVEQVYDFAEKIFAGSEQPYVQIEKEKIQDGILTAELTIPSGLAVESVKLYYMDLPELPYNDGSGVENPWTEIESGTIENNILTASVPAGATYAYASVVLYEGSNQFTADEISVSTKLMQVN